MGYNGSNRNPKFDVFPKRGLGSSDVSLILFLLLAPIFAIYMIVTVILELVSLFSTSKDKTENKSSSNKPSPYSKLITALSKDTRVTKLDYSNLVRPTIEIKQRIETLNSIIDTYKSRARSFGFIPKLKNRYIKKIQAAFREIHSLEAFNKIPVSADKPITEIEGEIYHNINTRLNSGNKINLDNWHKIKHKAQIPYAINNVPRLSFQFNPIELYFFNDALAIITKEDYLVINGDNIFAEYRTLSLDVSLANKDEKQFNVLDDRCRYFCKDGSIDLRYRNYRIVEMGVLELNITTQKIILLFSNAKYGYSIYKSLLDN